MMLKDYAGQIGRGQRYKKEGAGVVASHKILDNHSLKALKGFQEPF